MFDVAISQVDIVQYGFALAIIYAAIAAWLCRNDIRYVIAYMFILIMCIVPIVTVPGGTFQLVNLTMVGK